MTETLEQVLVWVGRMSWQASVLVVLVLMAQRLFQTRLAPRWRYALWWLVLLRLILPVAPEASFSIFNVVQGRAPAPHPAPIPQVPAPAVRLSGPSHPEALPAAPPELPPAATPVAADPPAATIVPDANPSSAPAAPESAWPLALWGLAGAWATGMGLLLARVLWGNLRFAQRLRRRRPLADPAALELLDECRRIVGVSQPRVVIETPEVDGPALFGCFRVKLLLPPGLAGTFSRAELRHVFLHELAHLRRWDVPANWLMTLLQIAHWFNPVIWLASSRMRTDRELACDALALSLIRDDERRPYGQTIIKFLEGFVHPAVVPGLVGILEEKAQMKRRIHMIARFKETSRWPILAVAVFLGLGLVALTDARSTPPLEKPSAGGITASDKAPAKPAPGAQDLAPPSASAADDIVDPNTAVKFVLAKTLSGANNTIKTTSGLMLSPDARFLLYWGSVIPLDGTETFRYTEHDSDVRVVAVSPNGRYIAHGWNTVWLQPVFPQTLRPNGPARKLLDLVGDGHGTHANWSEPLRLRWTQDSQVVFFRTYADGQLHQYAFSAATGDPVPYPDAASTGLPSPNGKCIALTDIIDGFWVKPMGDGAARVLWEESDQGEAAYPECWSRDGKWLIGFQPFGSLKGARFVSYPEGKVYPISLPRDVAKDNNANWVGASPDRETLYFYQTGFKVTHGVWVAPADGTGLSNVNVGKGEYQYQWAPDGKAVFHKRYIWSRTTGWKTDLFLAALSGETPTQFALDPAPATDEVSVSPDGKWLLFLSGGESVSRTMGLKLMPLSMADHGVDGPATVVFGATRLAAGTREAFVWSPDSTRVALTCRADPADEQDIWVVFTDGRTPVRLTRTAAIEHRLTWSPDGTMLAYIYDDAGSAELKVIPSAGGEAAVLRRWAGSETPLWGWSPDGKSLTLAEEGMLMRQPLSGGQAEPLINLKEYGIEGLMWLGWSSDGKRLALAHWPRGNKYGQLLFARLEGGRLQQTGATDLGDANWIRRYAWSPDSTRVACEYQAFVAANPEGRLYAVAVDDIVDRIEAGAIPPTGPKAAEPVTTAKPSGSEPTPQPEPITGPVFSDNFDNGLSEHWKIVPGNPEASPPPAHAVENGQLMLSNSSAKLSQIDWADYRVTVRVCVKEGEASKRGIAAIQTRATPSDFGSKNIERYALLFICSNDAPTCMLRLALYYHNASGESRGPTLDRDLRPLVAGQWYKLAFEVRGEHLRAYLDDKLVIETTDARLSKGPMWISASESPILFDDFSVRRLP